MLKKTARLLPAVLILLFFLQVSAGFADPRDDVPEKIISNIINGPETAAPSAILIETKRGQVLYHKQPTLRLHIPVANKIMTALVVLDKVQDLSAKVTVSKESVEAEGSALSLEAGEKRTVEDLLFAIILTSANDAAKALAEFAGGDTEKFVALMNDKAHELNMTDTWFTNPTGLYDENQYTTAYDTALLTKHAINNYPAFNRMFSYQAKPWTTQDGQVKILTNSNELFWSYEGVDGGKTGYNNKEQQSAITTATKGSQRLLCVVLDAPENSVFTDSVKLLDFGFNNFRTSVLVPKGYPQKTHTIGEKEVNLISREDVYYTHPIGNNYIKSLEFIISQDLNPPIGRDQVIGVAKYVLDDNTVIDVNLYPDIEIPLPENRRSRITRIMEENRDIFLLVAFLAAIEVILILYNIIKLIIKIVRKLSGHSSKA